MVMIPHEDRIKSGLCITLRVGESVKVGDTLVQIVAKKGQQIKLKFVGPKDTRIERQQITRGNNDTETVG